MDESNFITKVMRHEHVHDPFFKHGQIKLVAPSLEKNGKEYAYFVYINTRLGEAYPFMIGRTGNDLNGKFMADYSGNSYSIKQEQWNQTFARIVANNYSSGIARVMTLLAKKKGEVENEFPTSPLPNVIPYAGHPVELIDRMATAAALTVGPIRIKMLSDDTWRVEIEGKYTETLVAVQVKVENDKLALYLRVMSPRLALGRNVTFGGSILYPGLTAASWDERIASLPQRILDAVYNEEADSSYDDPYSVSEYRAAQVKMVRTITPNSLRYVAFIRPPNNVETNNTVTISHNLYLRLIGNEPYLVVKLTSYIGAMGWYTATPDNHGNDIIGISTLQAMNLGLRNGQKLAMLAIAQIIHPTHLQLRPRSYLPQQLFEAITDTLIVATTGHTVAYINPETDGIEYADVMSISQNGAAIQWGFLRDPTFGGSLKVNIELLPSLTLEGNNPLLRSSPDSPLDEDEEPDYVAEWSI